MYYGVSFKELNLEDYSEKSLEYLKNNLLILSALYGVLLAFDLLKKYRLDMTMSIIDKGLYNFWKKDKKHIPNLYMLCNLKINSFTSYVGITQIRSKGQGSSSFSQSIY